MEKSSKITRLAKSFNNTPIPFVPIVVVGVLVAMYVNSMGYLFFCQRMCVLFYVYHIAITIVFIFLLIRYYRYAEVLSLFESVDLNGHDQVSINYNRGVVNQLRGEYYNHFFTRVFLVLLFFVLWYFLKESYPNGSIYDYSFYSFWAIMMTVFTYIGIIIVMEFPLFASYLYYSNALQHQIIERTESMSNSFTHKDISQKIQ